MDRYKHMCMPLKVIPDKIIDLYQLRDGNQKVSMYTWKAKRECMVYHKLEFLLTIYCVSSLLPMANMSSNTHQAFGHTKLAHLVYPYSR